MRSIHTAWYKTINSSINKDNENKYTDGISLNMVHTTSKCLKLVTYLNEIYISRQLLIFHIVSYF
jgi:hypothetical protein